MSTHWDTNLFMTRAQIREYDRIATEEAKIPSIVLMENAGRGSAEVVAEEYPCRCAPVVILAGPGNNGGDGFVVARHLRTLGYDVHVHLNADPAKIAGDAKTNFDAWRACGGPIHDATSGSSVTRLRDALRGAGVIVDALLGTGVSRNLEGHIAEVIDLVNACETPVVALDIPTGLDADSGMTWGKSVHADHTVTFGHLKRGLLLYPGAELAGELHVATIGVPAEISHRAGFDGSLIHDETVRPLIPSRAPDSHKGNYGHLLLVAGSLGKTGAAVLAGRAAMRAGTGLVTIGTTSEARPVVEARCTELMVDSIIEKAEAPMTDKLIRRLETVLHKKAAIALGPGITTAPGISALAMRLLQMAQVPAVVDADGINILAEDPSAAGKISIPLVFTPHPGEMARLAGKTVASIQADRIGAARNAAKWHQAVIVLKGAHTVIAAPDGQTFICPAGNPGMASGGMGDVLTGLIGGFLAQGLSPTEAAIAGVYLHSTAGDRAAEQTGLPSLVASDVIDEIPGLLKELLV